MAEHLLSPVQQWLGIIHQSSPTPNPLVEIKCSTAAKVAALIHGALHEELVREVLLVEVARHQRLNALPVLGSNPEEGSSPWCKTPLVEVPSVEVSSQVFQIQVQLKCMGIDHILK